MSNKKSIEEVKRTKDEFQEEFGFFREGNPYSEWVNMCGISTVGIKDKNAPDDQKKNFCITVGLRTRHLPAGLSIPQEYHGVRVFVEEIGEIRFA